MLRAAAYSTVVLRAAAPGSDFCDTCFCDSPSLTPDWHVSAYFALYLDEQTFGKKTVDEDYEVQKARVFALAKDVEILNSKVQTWIHCYGALIAAEKDLSSSFASYFEQPPTDAWREGTMTYDEHVTQIEENEFKSKVVRLSELLAPRTPSKPPLLHVSCASRHSPGGALPPSCSLPLWWPCVVHYRSLLHR